MRSRRPRRRSPSGLQRQQIREIQPALQNVNARAALHLVRLFRLKHDEEQLARACDDLVQTTQQAKLLMDCCQAILESGRRPEAKKVQVIVGMQCDNCLGPTLRTHDIEGEPFAERGWVIQVEDLRHLTTRVTSSIFITGSQPKLRHQLMDCLAGLSRVLLRQDLFLQEIEPHRKPESEVITITEPYCIYCGAEISDSIDS